MKYRACILLLTAVFFSCQNNKEQQNSDSTNVISSTSITDDNETQKLINEFKPIIQGVWVKKDYIDEIARTKSPQLSFAKAGNITTMVVSANKISGDSLKFEVGYGNHEGGYFTFKFRPGSLPRTIIAYDPLNEQPIVTYQLQYNIQQADTTLTLFTFDKNNKVEDKTTYIRAIKDGIGKELGSGTNYLVNKLLISGDHILIDTLNNRSRVNFSNDGKVTGFSGVKTYDILVDFMTPPNNLDQIFFGPDNQQTPFTFKVNGDTINIYKTYQMKDSIDLSLGKNVYKLVKQH